MVMSVESNETRVTGGAEEWEIQMGKLGARLTGLFFFLMVIHLF